MTEQTIGQMTESMSNQQNELKLNKAIGISVALHVVLFSAFVLRAVFFPAEPMQIERAVRVDIVSLPDKSVQKLPIEAPPTEIPAPKAEPVAKKPVEAPKAVELPKPEAAKPIAKTEPVKPVPKAVIPDQPTLNLNKSKRDQAAALKRMEALARLEKMVKSQNAGKADKRAQAASAPQSAPIKGNEISKGKSLTGVARLDHQNYLSDLDSHVKSHWNLPQWLANANFKARVLVFVDAKGFVLKKQMTKSSGNPAYDERVMQAVENASPFPPPPSNLVNLFEVDGIELGFPE